VWKPDGTPASIAVLEQPEPVGELAISPDGGWIVTTAYGDTAQIWDTQSGARVVTLAGGFTDLHSLRFSADGTRLVTVDSEGVQVWHLFEPSTAPAHSVAQAEPVATPALTPAAPQTHAQADAGAPRPPRPPASNGNATPNNPTATPRTRRNVYDYTPDQIEWGKGLPRSGTFRSSPENCKRGTERAIARPGLTRDMCLKLAMSAPADEGNIAGRLVIWWPPVFGQWPQCACTPRDGYQPSAARALPAATAE
jgi:hypothetical protein